MLQVLLRCGVLTIGLSLAPQTVSAAPDETAEPAPKLVIAQESIPVEVMKGDLLDTYETSGTAEAIIILSNEGTEAARGVGIAGYYSDGRWFSTTDTVAGKPLSTIDPNSAVRIEVSFSWKYADGRDSGWFVATSQGQTTPPAIVPFQLHESVPGNVFGSIAGLAAVAALVLTVVAYFTVRVGEGARREIPPLGRVVYPAANWTFAGSWASSITALGAVLGTILAASGFLTEVLPGLSTGVFLGVNIGFLLLASLAAGVFVAAHNPKGEPTYMALLLAAAVTLWAVIGELATVVLLATRGGIPQEWILLAGIVSVGFLIAYARKSLLQVLVAKPPPPPKEDLTPEQREVVAAAEAAVGGPLRVETVTASGPSALL